MQEIGLPDFSFEKKLWKKGYRFVVGIDEAGRGAWAGPIVASACTFASKFKILSRKAGVAIRRLADRVNSKIKIDDSKRLRPREREETAEWTKKHALAWSVAEISVGIINRVGIGKAIAMAMRQAIKKLFDGEITALSTHFYSRPGPKTSRYPVRNQSKKRRKSEFSFLVDGFHVKYLPGGLKNQKGVIHGDQKSISIAAASILAKVYRDKIMVALGRKYPVYGWGRNKGYGTRLQQKAISRYGLTKFHRRQFVRKFLARGGSLFD